MNEGWRRGYEHTGHHGTRMPQEKHKEKQIVRPSERPPSNTLDRFLPLPNNRLHVVIPRTHLRRCSLR